jgi:hypothetical protein
MSDDKFLKQIYYDPRTGFLSAAKLFAKVKEHGYTKKEVDAFLKKQATRQINYRQPDLKKQYMPIISRRNAYQCDLTFIYDYKKFNGGYDTILCFINCLSRKAYAYPLKNKSAASVLSGFHQFLKDVDGKISELTSDNGSEFKNKEFAALAKKHNITLYYAWPHEKTKTSIVERFNGSLKNIILRYMTAKKTHKWVDVLPDILANYNSTAHSSLPEGKSPNDVTPVDEFWIRYDQQVKAQPVLDKLRKLNIGDMVRVRKTRKNLFEKQVAPFSKTLYKIIGKEGYTFRLQNSDGNDVEKPYRLYEVHKVDQIEDVDEEKKVEQPRKAIRKERKVTRALKAEDIKEQNLVRIPRSRQPARKIIEGAQK